MSNSKRLCLNMIVKNEMANLRRCLESVVNHIDCWVIGDTGSTDGTQEFIRSFFATRNLPGELHEFPFENFEQARNAALDHAYASPLDYDYLLFDDADMELMVEDARFRERLGASGYRLLQRTTGSLAYWNTRLVRRDAGARYKGVTHEYLAVPGEVQELNSVWYRDHASGSNRTDKFERDARLLLGALESDPENHRYWFYLAQSYRDAERTAEAVITYAKRAEMGGWDEEAWNARLQEARCLRKLGDEAGFVHQALAAFNRRPTRAEPLYDLARFYREKGMNDASVLFSEAGLAIERPEKDILFLEDFVYTIGLQEEYSISANYARDPVRKARGFAACNWLALSPTVDEGRRNLARSNLFFYLQPAKMTMPSFTGCPLAFTAPAGYRAFNPSVARLGDEIVVAQPVGNYTPGEDGRKHIGSDGAAPNTRNFCLRLSDGLAVESVTEILPPKNMPEPVQRSFRGLEDARLFSWENQLWCVASLRDLTEAGRCEQVLARIEENGAKAHRFTDWHELRPHGPEVNEQAWMPWVKASLSNAGHENLHFIRRYDPLVVMDAEAALVSESSPAVAARQFKGGTPVIAFAGGWLSLVHEALIRPDGRRYCQHRFALFDDTDALQKLSRPFYFNEKSVEFAAGLAWHPDGERLMISYGVGEGDPWIATVQAAEVDTFLDRVDRLPSAVQTQWSHRAATNIESAASPPDEASFSGAERNLGGERNMRSTEEIFFDFAPFLRDVDSPLARREQSQLFDARIAPLLGGEGAALPRIHCFYQVMSDTAQHRTLIAATTSMRTAGHAVRVWSYAPEKLDFLLKQGVEVCDAGDVMPRALFDRIVGGSEIRYFSDIFRYAVLYEHGGLWMDSDVILLRPFPFRGDHFFNLQWRGAHRGHFICGNVMHARPYSRHLRALYEMSVDRFHEARGKEFGDIGPKLLSDYIASDAGRDLLDCVFSPVFFNPIDWTEIDRFDKPIRELADYLNDERVFGIHLWTARNPAHAGIQGAPLISQLTDPLAGFPTFTDIADRFNTDKNRHTGNRHAYARIYDRLLSSRRFSTRRLMEIGLCRGRAERNQTETPSVTLWQSFFPFCHVLGVDLTDLSHLNNDRFTSYVCDQSQRHELRKVAAGIEPGSLDVIVDDGSHASFDQQLTLRELFPLLADGGWYFIENLDWQPPGENRNETAPTKSLLREIRQHGAARSVDPLKVSALADQFAEILFFDSHYELTRAKLLGGLVAIRKRGGSGYMR